MRYSCAPRAHATLNPPSVSTYVTSVELAAMPYASSSEGTYADMKHVLPVYLDATSAHGRAHHARPCVRIKGRGKMSDGDGSQEWTAVQAVGTLVRLHALDGSRAPHRLLHLRPAHAALRVRRLAGRKTDLAYEVPVPGHSIELDARCSRLVGAIRSTRGKETLAKYARVLHERRCQLAALRPVSIGIARERHDAVVGASWAAWVRHVEIVAAI
mmetsp:Transcript_47120/g.123655  ORF Transcript_47120/g.123655 Transcript_47120/m.123655 type:complete len:214 (-) Transcript_47120:777-1418(-)